MLINFETFLTLLSFVWIIGEVLVQALKDKLKIDKMLYSVLTFLILGIFAIIYDVVANKLIINPIFILNCIVFLILCILIPITGYDVIETLIKRLIGKK